MGEIGTKVVTLRSRLGMTQKDLADATGIPQATVSRIERGVIEQPRVEVLRKLADALHVTVDYLVDRTQQMSATDTVGADQRAAAIFRDYQDMTEEERDGLLALVHALRQQRKQKRGPRKS